MRSVSPKFESVSFQSYFDNTKRFIDFQLADFISKNSKLRLHSNIQYALLSSGKRLRPVMAMLSTESVGGRRENVVQLALSVELLHTATLVHDDILDQDIIRRNALAVHAKCGVKIAIMVGDALASLALSMVTDYDKEIFELMSQTCLALSDGEYMDIAMTDSEPSESEYIEKVKKKSASLFKAATRGGALVGEGSPTEIDSLSRFGENFGIAYQIKDDLSDITCLENHVPPDLREFGASLPAIHLYESGKAHVKEKLLQEISLAKNQGSSNMRVSLDKIYKNLEKSGALRYCNTKLDEYVKRAIANLNSLKNSVYKSYLVQMADSLRLR
jgi:geranylgeranyl pyrophosphate synthase